MGPGVVDIYTKLLWWSTLFD